LELAGGKPAQTKSNQRERELLNVPIMAKSLRIKAVDGWNEGESCTGQSKSIKVNQSDLVQSGDALTASFLNPNHNANLNPDSSTTEGYSDAGELQTGPLSPIRPISPKLWTLNYAA
jgi:hypothetical protein